MPEGSYCAVFWVAIDKTFSVLKLNEQNPHCQDNNMLINNY